eukprot:CAMPEP_0118851198 /NCGR_PEP_ID=MMETSP1163-20130328/727_1 /TAXON_ID=124430 /ORGANISM="Phaeomonas parva, Strain CCMP2877" /LENGTH=92 /DNA_ID=CAMNT_0006783497 /DNA_START=915 /DNA_END=1194 /DNA_ORIENTATION=+
MTEQGLLNATPAPSAPACATSQRTRDGRRAWATPTGGGCAEIRARTVRRAPHAASHAAAGAPPGATGGNSPERGGVRFAPGSARAAASGLAE